ncbi:MAG TPA: GspH/FimT family pseudopilin [Syntrophobacteria bacterium]|nr:GspH/FimT family pseudopilin [Syntrophobacteria bacterium]
MMDRERGATLTQLLVTLGVIGTLMVIGSHQINQWLPHYRLHAAARSLLVQIQRARLQAIYRGASYYLDFDLDGDGCLGSGGCLLWEDWNGNLRKDPLERGETVLDFLALPGVWLKPYPQELGGPSRGPHDTELAAGGGDGVSFNQNRLKFNPNGTCSAGTIYLHNTRGRTYAIRIRSHGLVQFWRHDRREWEQW